MPRHQNLIMERSRNRCMYSVAGGVAVGIALRGESGDWF